MHCVSHYYRADPFSGSVDKKVAISVTLDINPLAKKEKRDAAFSSVAAAVFLTAFKLVVGLLTGSLGILAEAAHSGLDLVAALVTLFSVRFSDQPPDEEHLYGHGKIENLSALVETLLLLITCAWIIYEAIQRLFFKEVKIEASLWAFAVMVTSIIVDVSRSRLLYRMAHKHKSQALEADALHFSTDIWSSTVVIVGLGLVWLGEQLGPDWAWLAQADAIAALAVAAIVIYVSLQLGRRAVSVLLDAAPFGLAERIAAEASQVPGVQTVGPVRARQAGAFTFVDLTVHVDRSASLEEAHQVAATVEARVGGLLHQADVVVHVDPERQQDESLPQTVGAVATRQGLRVHNIHAHQVRDRYFIDLHAEVPPDLTLTQAHERISHLEKAIRDELPHVSTVTTHIEPRAVPLVSLPGEAENVPELKAQIAAVVESVTGLHSCHEIEVRSVPDGYDIVLHCFADPDLPITEAHRLAELAENRLRIEVQGIVQVLVHLEPTERA